MAYEGAPRKRPPDYVSKTTAPTAVCNLLAVLQGVIVCNNVCTQEPRGDSPLPALILSLTNGWVARRVVFPQGCYGTLSLRTHPDIQLLLINNYFIEASSVEYRVPTTLRNLTVTNTKMSSININMTIDDMPTWCTPVSPPLSSGLLYATATYVP